MSVEIRKGIGVPNCFVDNSDGSSAEKSEVINELVSELKARERLIKQLKSKIKVKEKTIEQLKSKVEALESELQVSLSEDIEKGYKYKAEED